MDTKPMWQELSATPIGTIVGWILVGLTIISSICAATIYLYKAFEKYKKVKDEKDSLEATVERHDKEMEEIKGQLSSMTELIVKEISDVKNKLEKQEETKIKEIRHTLVNSGEKALAEKKMTIREYRAWMELFGEYSVVLHQNTYVESMKHKIDSCVEIIGELDEHGNDIE